MSQSSSRPRAEGGTTSRPASVVHVTESLGGGVLYLLHQLIKAQVEAGLDVTILYSIRRDTPAPEILDQLFPPPVSRVVVPMHTNISIKADIKSLREIAKLLKILRPDVIHLHSSKAGALGRVAARLVGLGKTLYYSPHGFSFLRKDVSWFKRALFFTFEIVGGLFGGRIIASSASEGMLAGKVVGRHRVSVVENCTDVPEFQGHARTLDAPVCVISAGRLSYQKAPWCFWKLADSLCLENATFTWVGDGELRNELESGATEEKIHVTGWIDRKDMWGEMSQSDVFVMTSLWEGMPLTLLDAQAIGLPSVVADVVGCRDVVIDGVTGFICKSDEELIEKVRLLIRDETLRSKMAQEASSLAITRFSPKKMHSEMLKAYNLLHDK